MVRAEVHKRARVRVGMRGSLRAFPDVRRVLAADHGCMTIPTETKKLRRSTTGKMVAGVCGGWAKKLGMDATVLRIILVAATIFGVGTPALLYVACWVL